MQTKQKMIEKRRKTACKICFILWFSVKILNPVSIKSKKERSRLKVEA